MVDSAPQYSAVLIQRCRHGDKSSGVMLAGNNRVSPHQHGCNGRCGLPWTRRFGLRGVVPDGPTRGFCIFSRRYCGLKRWQSRVGHKILRCSDCFPTDDEQRPSRPMAECDPVSVANEFFPTDGPQEVVHLRRTPPNKEGEQTKKRQKMLDSPELEHVVATEDLVIVIAGFLDPQDTGPWLSVCKATWEASKSKAA